jgi:hypothetical protein
MPSDDKNQLVHWPPMIKMWGHRLVVYQLWYTCLRTTDNTQMAQYLEINSEGHLTSWQKRYFFHCELSIYMKQHSSSTSTFNQHLNIQTSFDWSKDYIDNGEVWKQQSSDFKRVL